MAQIEEGSQTQAKGHLWGLSYYFEYAENENLRSLARVLREQRIERRPLPIRKFRGLDPVVLDRLQAEGIKHVKQVLAGGATPQARADLAARADVPAAVVLEAAKGELTARWVCEESEMEPKIIDQDQTIIVGMVYYGNPFQEMEVAPDQNEVGKLWARFSTYYDNNPQVFKGQVNSKVGWELHITTTEYEDTKEYYVMVGVEMPEITDLPLPTFAKVLPAGHYAVFTLRGEEMSKDWGKAIYKEWLPSSEYEEAFQCTIERYHEDYFKGWGDPDSEVEIWVPINVKG